jgi:hypothetical protein
VVYGGRYDRLFRDLPVLVADEDRLPSLARPCPCRPSRARSATSAPRASTADPGSQRAVEPDWRPTIAEPFGMADLLAFATS